MLPHLVGGKSRRDFFLCEHALGGSSCTSSNALHRVGMLHDVRVRSDQLRVGGGKLSKKEIVPPPLRICTVVRAWSVHDILRGIMIQRQKYRFRYRDIAPDKCSTYRDVCQGNVSRPSWPMAL